MQLHLGEEPRRRAMDYSNRDARRAVADVIDRIAPWRLEIAKMMARAETGRLSPDDLTGMVEECSVIATAIAEARTDLIIELAEAPAKVTGHSRVVDAERALDNVEAAVAEARRLIGSMRSSRAS